MKADVESGSQELLYELEVQDLKAFFRNQEMEYKHPIFLASYLNLIIKINRSVTIPCTHVY